MTTTTLTDQDCATFRRHPGSFNDMVRAIYAAGIERGKAEAIEIIERLHGEAYSGGSEFGHLDGHAIIAEIEGKEIT